MTENIVLEWELHSSELEQLTIERHCQNCGRKVIFHDSMIRRHNANGKNIYQFAIYKCERGHTWNKKLDIYKSFSGHRVDTEFAELEVELLMPERISIEQVTLQQADIIEIHLKNVTGRWRLDKLLAQQLEGFSRSQINQAIEQGWITVDGQKVKASSNLRFGQTIQLNLNQLKK